MSDHDHDHHDGPTDHDHDDGPTDHHDDRSRRREQPATATAPPAEAAGVTQLQGCIATFAPPAGA